MLPIKSNITSSGCIPTSSDCIIWQGPNIPCINLCTGDSITDVTYKLAEKLCTVQSAYDLTPLDLSDLVTFCTAVGGAPTGTNKNLLNVLDFIVKKLGCVNDKVDAIVPGTTYTEPSLTLPTCLQYSNGAGGTVTQLVHNEYTLRIATKYCELKTVVDGHSTTISNLDYRVTVLEAKPGFNLPKVTPECDYPNFSITKGTSTAIDVLLDAVESELCGLRSVLGSNTQIGSAAVVPAAVCGAVNNLNTASALSKPGTTMSSYTGWNSTVVNLAQSVQNLWITVMDMRCIIADLKNCCGQVDCSGYILDYEVSTDANRQNVTVNFFNKLFFPSTTGVTNGTGSEKPKLEITDGINTIVNNDIDLVALRTNTTGFTVQVFGTGVTSPLNPSRTYTVKVTGAIVKDGKTCYKEKEKISSPPCSSITGEVVVSLTPTA